MTPEKSCLTASLFGDLFSCLLLTFALCSTLAFLSSSRLTTSVLPWKHARVSAVFLLVSIWAFISEPMSSNSLTAAVCPFMAANIKGEMPNLLPVLKEKKKKPHSVNHNHISQMTRTKLVKAEYLSQTKKISHTATIIKTTRAFPQ